jgi:predicted exporter
MREAVADQAVGIKPEAFAPFVADVEAARTAPPLTRADLRGTSMALAVDSLLTQHAGGWSAMLALRAHDGAQALQAAQIQAAVARAGVPGALFVDLKTEADRLYVNYEREAVQLSLAGFAGIAVLLALALRSPLRAARALAPLVAAVLAVAAGFALAGVPLTILHLVGMLLIVAVGSNYALFFCQPGARTADSATVEAGPRIADRIAPHTLVSLLIANLATVAGFGLLALSRVPLLETFGLTVGPGAMLALAFAAILAPQTVRTGRTEAVPATAALPAGRAGGRA